MIILKNLKLYDGYEGDLKDAGAFFLISEDGHDWYKSQLNFQENTLKVLLSENNVVLAYTYDVTSIWPVNMSVVEIESFSDPESIIGKVYNDDGTFTDRPSRAEQPMVTFNRLSERKKILDMKKEFDIITPTEEKEYKKIVQALKSLLKTL